MNVTCVQNIECVCSFECKNATSDSVSVFK